jgi:capsular polysaccharide biosynthesis protein
MIKRLFWRPRGTLLSLCDYRAGPLTDVTPLLSPPPNRDHPLLVAEVPGGKIIGNAMLVATAGDQVFSGIQGLHAVDDPQNHWLLRRRRLRFPRRIPGAAFLLTSNGDNYFHWLYESLPRLQLLRLAGWNIQRADWIIASEHSPAFQEQTLDLLGVPREKIMRCSKWRVQEFDRLIVPAMPSSTAKKTPAWVAKFLRDSFLPAETPVPHSRIYVSRRGTTRRRLANEAELEERLHREHGFQICALESMSFREQVALFASARIVLAPHGAGLSNLVFSPPGGHLIELFHPEHRVICYEGLAATIHFHYHPLLGRSTSPHPSLDDRTSEYSINIAEVIGALRTVEKTFAAKTD